MLIFGLEIPLAEMLGVYNILMIAYIIIAIYEIMKLREEVSWLKSFKDDTFVKMLEAKKDQLQKEPVPQPKPNTPFIEPVALPELKEMEEIEKEEKIEFELHGDNK